MTAPTHERPEGLLVGDQDESAVFAGRRVLLVDPDPARADALAQELRARQTLVVISDVDGRGLGRARGLDPEIAIVDETGFKEPGFPVIQQLRMDPRLRWASLLVGRLDEVWPKPNETPAARGATNARAFVDPNISRLAGRVASLVAPDLALQERAAIETDFEAQLESIGPARILRALSKAERTLHVTVKGPQGEMTLDLSGDLIVGCVGTTVKSPEKLDGSRALASLLGFASATVRVERRDHPSVLNIMLPVDEALAAAAVERPPNVSTDAMPAIVSVTLHTDPPPPEDLTAEISATSDLAFALARTQPPPVPTVRPKPIPTSVPPPRVSSLPIGVQRDISSFPGPPPARISNFPVSDVPARVSSFPVGVKENAASAFESQLLWLEEPLKESSSIPPPPLGEHPEGVAFETVPSESAPSEESFAEGEPAFEPIDEPSAKPRKPARWMYIAAAVLVLAIVAAAVVLMLPKGSEKEHAETVAASEHGHAAVQAEATAPQAKVATPPPQPPPVAPSPEPSAAVPDEAAPTAVEPAAEEPVEAAAPAEPVDESDVDGPNESETDAFVQQGNRLLGQSQIAEAEAAYQQALTQHPTNTHAMVGLARARLARRDGRGAVAWAEKAVARRPKRVAYRVLLGDAHAAAGNGARAAAEWLRALEYDPGNRDARNRLSGLGLAR